MKFWQALARWWSAWIGDRDVERLVRARLSREGYQGESARFQRFQLIAIQRPGWVQVFEFSVEAQPKSSLSHSGANLSCRLVHGLLRQDERYKRAELALALNPIELRPKLAEWTRELIVLRRLRA